MRASSEETAIFAQQICYLGRVWIPFSFFHFVLILCKKPLPKLASNVLALFHAATYFLVLFLQHNTLYYRSFSFVEDGLFPHLVNLKKIVSVRPALNSRLYAKMPNDEEILVSRKYAHALKEAIA